MFDPQDFEEAKRLGMMKSVGATGGLGLLAGPLGGLAVGGLGGLHKYRINRDAEEAYNKLQAGGQATDADRAEAMNRLSRLF